MKKTIGYGDLKDGVYVLKETTRGRSLVASHDKAYFLWHARMGHPSQKTLFLLSNLLNFRIVENNMTHYDVCHRSKQCRNSFLLSDNKASQPLL